jgi:hypothetical protein
MGEKMDFDSRRKGVMVGKLSDGRVMCVKVEMFLNAMSTMPMSWLDDPQNWLKSVDGVYCWVEEAPKPVQIKRADWVKCEGSVVVGIVKRVARDGSWCDVDWGGWHKRMNPAYLVIHTTLDFGDGWTVTDETRAKEVARQA